MTTETTNQTSTTSATFVNPASEEAKIKTEFGDLPVIDLPDEDDSLDREIETCLMYAGSKTNFIIDFLESRNDLNKREINNILLLAHDIFDHINDAEEAWGQSFKDKGEKERALKPYREFVEQFHQAQEDGSLKRKSEAYIFFDLIESGAGFSPFFISS